MSDSVTTVPTCDQCGGVAEPPLVPVFDPYEMRVAFHVCQACVDGLGEPARARPGADPAHQRAG